MSIGDELRFQYEVNVHNVSSSLRVGLPYLGFAGVYARASLLVSFGSFPLKACDRILYLCAALYQCCALRFVTAF